MTVIALVFGSVLGFFSAMIGWLFWDVSATYAFGLYLGTALGFALFSAVTLAQGSALRDLTEAEPQMG